MAQTPAIFYPTYFLPDLYGRLGAASVAVLIDLRRGRFREGRSTDPGGQTSSHGNDPNLVPRSTPVCKWWVLANLLVSAGATDELGLPR
jgi:hypothetical protein